MLQKRLLNKVSVALFAAFMIGLCPGCEPLQDIFDKAPPGEEKKTAVSSPETGETELSDVPTADGPIYPIFFDDPSLDYLGIEKYKILLEYGEPEEIGDECGGNYLSYAKKAGLIFFFSFHDFEDDNGLTSAVWIFQGEIMGVEIGATFPEIMSTWGEPDGSGYDQHEFDMWFLVYSFPEKNNGSRTIAVYFFAETEDGASVFAFIKPECQ